MVKVDEVPLISQTDFSRNKVAGEYEIYLNGNSLASGVYFIILRTSEHIYSHKILLLK